MIIVDTREPWERIIDHLGEIGAEPEYRVDTLHHKIDFEITPEEDVIGVQRKTCNDFVSSIDTLKDDLYELRQHCDIPVFLLEGDWRLAGSTIGLRRGSSIVQTVPTQAWHNFIISQQLREMVYVRTSSLKDTCRVLVHLHDYFQGVQSPPVDDIGGPEQILQMFPDIGPGLAQNLLDNYENVYTALKYIDRWDEVDGIGGKTRMNVKQWLLGHDENDE